MDCVRAVVVAVALAVVCGACGGTTVSQVVGPSADRCQTQVSGIPQSVPSSGAQVTATIATTRDCTWTVTTDASWLQVTPANGQGEASIGVTVAENPAGSSRAGSIAVNGAQFNVTQQPAPCRFQIDASSRSVAAQSGSFTVSVTTLTGCAWSSSSGVSWVRAANASGTGSGPAQFNVDANTGPSRTGSVTVAGSPVTVVQAAGGTPPPPPPPPSTAVSFQGTVSNLSGSCPSLRFVVSGYTVVTDASTRFASGSCKDVSNGASVQGNGVLQASGTVYASTVQIRKK